MSEKPRKPNEDGMIIRDGRMVPDPYALPKDLEAQVRAGLVRDGWMPARIKENPMSEKSALAVEIAALLASENTAQAERIEALEEEIRRVQSECHAETALLHEAIRKLGRRIGVLEEMP